MISAEEIKKLADLARIELKEEEIEKMRGEIGAVLDYVSQVSEIAGSASPLNYKRGLGGDMNINVLREDVLPKEPEIYNKDLVAEFPEKEGGFLKVKKILG